MYSRSNEGEIVNLRPPNEQRRAEEDVTSEILFTPKQLSWKESAIAFIRKNWDVEEGLTTYASKSRHFDSGVRPIPPDVFCSLLVYDVLGSEELGPVLSRSFEDFFLRYHHESGINYFFVDRSLISPSGIMADVDTASVYLTVLLNAKLIDRSSITNAIAKLVQNTDNDGVVQVFFPPRGRREGRLDPVVCANVLALLYQWDCSADLSATEHFIWKYIESEQFLNGSLQYTYASAILLSATRAFRQCKKQDTRQRFMATIRRGFFQLMDYETQGDLDLAMRIITAKRLGIDYQHIEFMERLLRDHQSANGSWGKESMYRTVRSALNFGSDSLTTAFAIRALID